MKSSLPSRQTGPFSPQSPVHRLIPVEVTNMHTCDIADSAAAAQGNAHLNAFSTAGYSSRRRRNISTKDKATY